LLALVVTGLAVGGAASAQTSADPTKNPHYFGPYPNWANSPLTYPDATVTVQGDGTGVKAVATVGANGAITAIDVTDGGSGYGTAKVVITGSGSGASADAEIIKKGAVADITVTNGGHGYTKPVVTITANGGGGTGATATAYGRVDGVSLSDFGQGYTMPTVSFDLPDDPNGVIAEGRVTCQETDCQPAIPGDPVTITGVEVTSPGSGYASAPGVAILNGTQFAPMDLKDAGHFAVAKATLKIDSQRMLAAASSTVCASSPKIDAT